MHDYKLLVTTTNSKEVAQKIQRIILENRLSPYINVLDNIQSSYLWEGKVATDKEIMLIIKSTSENIKEIKETILEIEKNIPNLELIIIDDNSTDDTRKIIDELNHDKRIKLIHRKKSRSLASAFMRGVIETSGDYIGWLDTNMPEVAPRFVEMASLLNSSNDAAEGLNKI